MADIDLVLVPVLWEVSKPCPCNPEHFCLSYKGERIWDLKSFLHYFIGTSFSLTIGRKVFVTTA